MTMNPPDVDEDDESSGINQDHPYRVLGVALVVDQKGSGAKLVCRYPTQPNNHDKVSTNPSDPSSSREDPSGPAAKELHTDDDLFFTLTARQMAKLFRTKKTLCGNPMTLSVNGTVFCCRAVLMQGEDGQDETIPGPAGGNDSHNDDLVLFSVVVALSAPMSHTSVQFSTGSWLDTGTEDQLEIQRYVKESGANRPGKTSRGRVSAGFLAIRRVHLSLARICRVLEREERRCHYVTFQSQLASQIRSDHQKKWEEKKAASESSNANNTNNKQATNGISSSSSVLTAKSTQTTSERRPRHHRSASFSTTVGGEDVFIEVLQRDFTVEEEQEKEQEILELMLAASPPKPRPGVPKHYGNLVRELVQFFHSLSRNDHIYPPTPMSLLIERDGVVYINQHIAIPVEAAAPKPSHAVDNPTIRPYYTLLFPHASPSDLLQALQSSGSTPPQKLQQLLLTVNAQKPMTEIAIDANLSLNTTLEMASYLVRHGVCVMSPVVSRQSRLACHQVERIPELALEFSQLFGNVHVFRVVGFLTSMKTLGAAMSLLTNTDQDEGSWLRDALSSSGRFRPDRANNNITTRFDGDDLPARGTMGQPLQGQELSSSWKEEMEEQLYAMTVWLISHRVLTQLQEYIIVVGTEQEDVAPITADIGSSTTVPIIGYSSTAETDENLFRELLESDFLNGEISIMALSWKLGLDAAKVRAWALRHPRVRVVSRITRSSDDWEPSNGQ